MKKLLLSITVLPVVLFPVTMKAQKSMREYYSLNMLKLDPENNFYDEQSAPLKLRKQLKIKSIQSTHTQKNGKQFISSLTYNDRGRITHFSSRKRNSDYTYVHDTLLSGYVSTYRGDTYKATSAFENGKIVSRDNYKNDKLTSRLSVRYNAQGNVLKSQLEQGRKKYEIQYTYGEDGKMTKTVYLVNGKVKKEWIYECKPKGQIVASRTEAMSSFCTYHEESADGSFTKYTRTLKEGKPYLLKETFSKDSALISSRRFLNETKLVWESVKENHTETITSYKDSGRLRFKQITTFDDQGNVTSREYYHKQQHTPQTKSIFELNADGTMRSRTFYWKGKPNGTTAYTFSFY